MAEKPTKAAEQAASVEERLKSLYELQTILSNIDRIRTVRGELPLEVKDLEDTIEGLRTRLDNLTREMNDYRAHALKEQEKIHQTESQLEQHKSKIDNIRNNREYDLLNKEIESLSLNIQIYQKHINEDNRAIAAKELEIEATRQSLDDNAHILDEKRSELDEIVNETRQEEDALREKAKLIEPRIDQRTLTAFKRIRKNARNGLGIVYINRNACGGCFNRIPPQRQMEVKMHKKIIVCEYCGRIIIDPELAGVAPTE